MKRKSSFFFAFHLFFLSVFMGLLECMVGRIFEVSADRVLWWGGNLFFLSLPFLPLFFLRGDKKRIGIVLSKLCFVLVVGFSNLPLVLLPFAILLPKRLVDILFYVPDVLYAGMNQMDLVPMLMWEAFSCGVFPPFLVFLLLILWVPTWIFLQKSVQCRESEKE